MVGALFTAIHSLRVTVTESGEHRPNGQRSVFGVTDTRVVMQSSTSRKRSLLPKWFPVGTTYVVEGRGGENGELQVCSRYVVLPGGERINLDADRTGSAPRNRRARGQGRPAKSLGRAAAKSHSAGAKKIIAGAGTTRLRRR